MRGEKVSGARFHRRQARAVRSLLALVVIPIFLGSTANAEASYDAVGSGSTTIELTKTFRKLLRVHGVKIQTTGGARTRGANLVLPATEGEVEPILGLGTVTSEGSIVFVAGKRRLPFRTVVFKAQRTPLYAKIGGGQLKVAKAARVRSRRDGFGASFEADLLRLTAKCATRLDKKLDLGRSIAAGQLLGTLRVKASPSTVHLREQGRVNLALDAAFAKKLNDLFVSVNPIAPAEVSGGPVLSLPIGPESTLAPDYSGGILKLGGAVELLKLGTAQLFWREFWLEPGSAALAAETETLPSPPHPGKQLQAPILSLPQGATVTADARSRAISVSGQPLVLTAVAATALNEAFAESRPVFAVGETVGSLSLSSQAE
jgi:hypothetical protein